jgi:hypothetical protein
MLALMESGTHAIFAAAIGRYDTSEVALAPPLLERLRPGMLCLAGFVGFELWQAARAPTCCGACGPIRSSRATGACPTGRP